MNRILTFCVMAALVVTPVMAAVTVDLGTNAGEAGVVLSGWGNQQAPIDTSYGNIFGDAGSLDNAFRVVWEPTNPADDSLRSASITFDQAITSVNIRYLNGFADDSFEINVYGDGSLWGTISAPASTVESWVWTGVLSGTPGTTLTLTATGDAWSGFTTYGQLAIDRIEVTPVPAPGAILLAGIGTSLVGWLRRRRAL